jgi:hypothetical protein
MFNYSTGFVSQSLAQIATLLNNGVIEVYSGSRPTTADSSIKGTLLGVITSSGLAFTAGSPTNGLQFETNATDGTINKSSTQTWQFTALATDTAGWLRIKANVVDAGGVSTELIRLDGTIAAYGGDAKISGANGSAVEFGKVYTIDSCTLNWAK